MGAYTMWVNTVSSDDTDFRTFLEETPQDVSRIKPLADWGAQIEALCSQEPSAIGTPLPWTHEGPEFRIRSGELTIYGGINGHGKSLVLSQIMLWLASQNQKILLASMEMRPEVSGLRMARQATRSTSPSSKQVFEFMDRAGKNIWVYDQFGVVNSDRLIDVCRYAVQKKDCTHIVIDSLTKIDINSDDYSGQKNFINRLHTFALNHNVHIHLVHHLRKSDSEKRAIDKFDLRGAGEIADQCDNIWLIWRNKAKEESTDQSRKNQPDTVMKLVKQRNGTGEEGKIGLAFHYSTQQFVPTNAARPLTPPNWPTKEKAEPHHHSQPAKKQKSRSNACNECGSIIDAELLAAGQNVCFMCLTMGGSANVKPDVTELGGIA